MIPEKWLAWAGGMLVFGVFTLGVAAGDHLFRTPIRRPTNADRLRALLEDVGADLDEDLEAVRGYRARDWSRVLVETWLAPGLLFRALIHIAATRLAAPRADVDVDVGLVSDPITSPRPAWCEISARVSAACVGAWALEAVPTSGGEWVSPELRLLALAIGASTVGVLLADPGVAIAERDPIRHIMQKLT